MRTAIITGGTVSAILHLDGKTIDPDGSAARGPAVYKVEHPDGTSENVEYESVFDAPDGSMLVASETAGQGWGYVNGVFVAPTVSPADLIAYARDTRWRIEVGGILISGVPVATDDRSKIMIVGARVAAAADPAWSTVWQGADGNAYPVDAVAMIAISEAVQAHVNASFATLATVLAEIEAGTISTAAQIDAFFGLEA